MRALPGRMEIRRIERGILECSCSGFITRDVLHGYHAEMQAILDAQPGSFLLLQNLLPLDGYEPGLPMAKTRWFTHRIERFSGLAVITRNTPLIAVAQAIHYFLRPLPYGVFPTRDEALRFLDGACGGASLAARSPGAMSAARRVRRAR